MSFLKMHIAISKKIKDELNYSDIFLLRAILPDIIKLIIKDREVSHFEKDGFIDLDKFISRQKNFGNELILGYYVHLIQDEIWYESYMIGKYLKLPEYSNQKLYSDYSFVDNIFYNDIGLDTQNISEILHGIMQKINIKDVCIIGKKFEHVLNNESIESKLSEIWKDYSSDENNYFYTIHDAKEYYNVCL